MSVTAGVNRCYEDAFHPTGVCRPHLPMGTANSDPPPQAAGGIEEGLLTVRGLSAVFGGRRALRGVSFSLSAGERLGIVGESGAGKSLLALSLLNLIAPPGKIDGGEILFCGRDILRMPEKELRAVRGARMAMVFQDPMTTLNPVLTVEEQLTECVLARGGVGKKEAREMALRRLREVAMPAAEARLRAYPHELSGGMRQRVVIAAALITNPLLLIADEPTTALDVTIQAEIMSLLAALCAGRQMALILITHDLSLASQMTDRLMVMYAGGVVESGATADVIRAPLHPYTRGLLAALPENQSGGRFNQIPGRMPSLAEVPGGCAFHPRCSIAREDCKIRTPVLEKAGGGRLVACPYCF